MNRQEFYRQKYRRIKPDWRDSLTIYRSIIDGYMTPDTKILDVGCGHGFFMQPVFSKTPHTYGIDSDQVALAKNTLLKHKVAGVVEDMPFKNSFFDLVVSEWVLEHLPNPEKAFQEIYRVLKPGGKVVFLTPNAWNYNTWIIRAVPNRFHDFFTRKLYGRQEGDTYPVKYKVNSVKKVAKILGTVGFKKIQMIINGDPSYISFNSMLFKISCLIEKLHEIGPLKLAKVHLIGIYEK